MEKVFHSVKLPYKTAFRKLKYGKHPPQQCLSHISGKCSNAPNFFLRKTASNKSFSCEVNRRVDLLCNIARRPNAGSEMKTLYK